MHRKVPVLCACLVILRTAALCADPSALPFVIAGRVYLADVDALSVRPVGRLSPAARTVTWGPDGLIWGRVDPNFLAALDPTTGSIAAQVPLRFRPYDHVVAPGGKAYVAHNALTDEGFTVSIVDLGARRTSGQISAIRGLHTSIVQAAGCIYLTALGVARDDRFDLYLYRIDSATETLRLLRHLPAGRVSWRLFSSGDAAFLLTIPRTDTGTPALLEAIDSASGTMAPRIASIDPSRAKGLLALLGEEEGRLLFVARIPDGRSEVVRFSDGGDVDEGLRIPGGVRSFVGFRDDVIVSLDYGSEAGVNDTWVSFFSLREKKEVMRIKLSQ